MINLNKLISDREKYAMKCMKHLVGLLFLCSSAIAQAQLLDYIVAIVNDDVIVNSRLEKELDAAYDRLIQQGIQVPNKEVIRKQVLDSLIIDKLQRQIAERLKIQIDDNTLNAAVRQIAAQNNITFQQLPSFLATQGLNIAELREELRGQLLIRRLQQRQVVNRINVTEREINNAISNQKKLGDSGKAYHLFHILIALPEDADEATVATRKNEAMKAQAQLKAGGDFRALALAISDANTALDGGDLGWRKYNEIPSLFSDAVKTLAEGDVSEVIQNRSGFHIIKLAELKDNQTSIITQTKARHILVKTSELVSDDIARQRLESLKNRAQLGDDFAELARANSDDTASAIDGGDLGWVSPGAMVNEFEEVMNEMTANQISDPFKSRFGWHIIQVQERRQYNNTKEALRTKAAKEIRARKINEELQIWLRQLRDEAYVEYRLNNEYRK